MFDTQVLPDGSTYILSNYPAKGYLGLRILNTQML